VPNRHSVSASIVVHPPREELIVNLSVVGVFVWQLKYLFVVFTCFGDPVTVDVEWSHVPRGGSSGIGAAMAPPSQPHAAQFPSAASSPRLIPQHQQQQLLQHQQSHGDERSSCMSGLTGSP